ncbi:hypothetical protein D187_003683 [Cystobacter fuscus DSM 2262]|uniref:Carboxypeptidase regulatory-like domain-containing protein n=1 Tax=Cystobacter fuscus (strain ATCC 25194 / DSM 2262 / NBRC 100088 / M29) TaxID=1242864 RepID=S9P8Y6_CYSF2|nr:carboxypeptidase regulatory-like domain-containing protein [Cystobacter fuscus]EPX58722.1 hypothetical protein D187_003683 [Cystobacter fuscus DSM 2262]
MRSLTLVVVAMVGVILLLWLGLWGSADLTEGDAPAPRPELKSRAGLILQPESPEDEGARGDAEAGSTPPLAEPPTEDEGVLEVEVLADGRPVSGADVRLYWRGARDRGLGEVAWRLASTGTTDAQGRAWLASRPGAYLVAVHAEGRAVSWRVVRPYGEARTNLRLELAPGHSLTGRTVVARTSEPVPRVELVLTAYGGLLGDGLGPEAPREEQVHAMSNERGDFHIEGLSAGSYLLEARAPGRAPKVLDKVVLPAAAPLTVALERAGVIQGFVVDAQGQPVANAEVRVSGPSPQPLTTDERGGFSAEVSTGAYLLSARHGTEAGSVDKPLFVWAGEAVRDVRIRLEPGATLEGRVLAWSTGFSVEGARVSVRRAGHRGDAASGVTDRAGLFSLKGLAAGGTYELVVDAPGYSRLTRRGLMVAAGERFPLKLNLKGTGTVEGQVRDAAGAPLPGVWVQGGSRWAGRWGRTNADARTDAEGYYRIQGRDIGREFIAFLPEGVDVGLGQPVDVKAEETTRVDFTFQGAGTLEGVVRTARGSPPSVPLEVAVQPKGPASSSVFHRSGWSRLDPTGRFKVVLPRGSYDVHVLSDASYLGRQPVWPKVDVEAGRTMQTELPWWEGLGEVLRIKGLVVEPDGTPSPGAKLRLFIEELPSGGGPSGPAVADEKGRFHFSFVLEGEKARRLVVTAKNGGRVGEARQEVKRGEQQVAVTLRPEAPVRGRVVRRDGQPVRGFVLSMQLPEWKYPSGWDTREFHGDRFELPDVPDDTVTLAVRTLEGSIGQIRLSPVERKGEEVTVLVGPAAAVRGRVVDAATNAPLARAFVFLKEQRYRASSTRADGRFTLEDLSSGEGTLEFQVRGLPHGHHPVTLVPGQLLDVGDIPIESRRASGADKRR